MRYTTTDGPKKPLNAIQEGSLGDKMGIAAQKPKQKLICHSCGVALAYNVAKFCWFNKAKFGGNLYCMDCQKKV